MSELRRAIEAIITAQRMDPARRELFVEGNKDLLFFKWLIGEKWDPNSLIIRIDDIDVPGPIEGGNRARLLVLASQLLGKVDHARIFIDADFDRLLGREDNIPEIVWLSDGRDLESYYIREDCFDKFVSLSLCTESFSGSELLNSLVTHCRKLGFFRLLSEIKDLRLPFQGTNLHRHINFHQGTFTLDFDAYVTALVGRASLSQRIVPELISNLQDLNDQHNDLPDTDIIHGNDFICFIGEVLRKFDIDRNSSSAVFRSTFERGFSPEYQSLSEAIDYLCV